jgi:hypothetical protein
MRVLTFQSQEVLETILKDGIYYADSSKAREGHNYHLDIAQLGGKVPVWCFVSLTGGFTSEKFIDGILFNRYNNEMSLWDNKGLSGFLMFELEVPEEQVFKGLTHNAYLGAKVMPFISKESLCAVYQLKYEHWYYPEVFILRKFRGGILFPEPLQCKAQD